MCLISFFSNVQSDCACVMGMKQLEAIYVYCFEETISVSGDFMGHSYRKTVLSNSGFIKASKEMCIWLRVKAYAIICHLMRTKSVISLNYGTYHN